MKPIGCAIIGPGNIGIDLMEKIRKRPELFQLNYVAGVIESSAGIQRAKSYGIHTLINNIEPILEDKNTHIVFDATSAKAHLIHAKLLKQHNKFAIDLTPAAVGKRVVPPVNAVECQSQGVDNVNLVTCGGQATIPIVSAVSRVAEVDYAEIVATISSQSAGPGTRKNIDEFTQTTKKAIKDIGKVPKAKAIIILNPADPPMIMRNTIYTHVKHPNMQEIEASVNSMVAEIQQYVPGYRVIYPPTYDGEKVTTMIEVTGAGDYLPHYAGNLDIITSAAIRVAEHRAKDIQGGCHG